MRTSTVDVAFPVKEARVSRDHGYALYAAISRLVPELHAARWLGIHPLSGKPAPDGTLAVAPASGLRLRLPVERIGDVLALAGGRLDVGGVALSLGAPSVHALVPAASLDARLVLVKLTGVPRRDHPTLARSSLDRAAMEGRTLAELTRQLRDLGIESEPELKGHGRMTVAGRALVGFAVRVQGLDADASLALQTQGLGGKRRMGCGLFRPTRGR